MKCLTEMCQLGMLFLWATCCELHMITFSRILVLKRNFSYAQKTSLIHSFAPTIDPSSFLLHFLTVSAETQSLKLTQLTHAKAHRAGLTQHSIIAQKLIFLYSKFKEPVHAKLAFDSTIIKNSHICNTLLSGYGKNDLFLESFQLFKMMCESSISSLVDEFSFSVMFKILGDSGEAFHGKMFHAMGLKTGIVSDTVVGNALMSVYGRFGCFDDSLSVFDEMPHRNVSSWNTVISGYVKVNLEEGRNSFDSYTLWEFVKGMQNEGLKFDAFTVSTLLPLCGGEDAKMDKCSNMRSHGKELHSYIIKNGLDISSRTGSDVHLGCCLIDIYSKNGRVDLGRRVFNALKYKNVFTWTAMINGYIHCGNLDEAIFHFREMQWREGVEPNKVSLVTILSACNSVAGLIGGKQIHAFAVRRELNHELSLCNALIDTYSKCGSLTYAKRMFEYECISKDTISWSSMISGYGLHGQGQNAVNLFDKMLHNGIKPDTTVLVGVLSACCRSGLVNDGIRIYDSVMKSYNIKPTIEICACMVDMLGKSGQLNRAMNFIKNMPMEPGPSIWGSLVCASKLHGNIEMIDLAYKSLIKIEPENPSNYISLSNLYAASKRWDVVSEVRTMMKEKGLRKLPGCSWISINSVTHSFFVADKSHPCYELIYTRLNELVSEMKLSCHNSDFVYLMEV